MILLPALLLLADRPVTVVMSALLFSLLFVLPRIRSHPTPNLEHMLLHGCTLAAAAATWAYAVR